MTYELVLTFEAEQHLKEWKRSGQKKTLKKISDLFEESTGRSMFLRLMFNAVAIVFRF